MSQDIFALRIKARMKELDMTREDLAEKAFISIHTLNSYLREKKPANPSIYIACDIAQALDISLEFLMGLNEVQEFSHKNTITPEVMLTNLYTVIKDTGLTYEVDNDTVTITSKNHFVALFLQQMSNLNRTHDMDIDKVHQIANLFKNLKIYKNQIVDTVTYDYLIANDKIYNDISENDLLDEAEATQEIIDQRTKKLLNNKV